jgi:hypothetical protein
VSAGTSSYVEEHGIEGDELELAMQGLENGMRKAGSDQRVAELRSSCFFDSRSKLRRGY